MTIIHIQPAKNAEDSAPVFNFHKMNEVYFTKESRPCNSNAEYISVPLKKIDSYVITGTKEHVVDQVDDYRKDALIDFEENYGTKALRKNMFVRSSLIKEEEVPRAYVALYEFVPYANVPLDGSSRYNLHTQNGKLYVIGWSACNEEDEFDIRMAEKLAYVRASRRAEEIMYNFWKANISIAKKVSVFPEKCRITYNMYKRENLPKNLKEKIRQAAAALVNNEFTYFGCERHE